MQTQKKEINQYIKKCPKCKMEIRGYSESQVLYNLAIHINAKHKIKDLEAEK